MAKQKSPLTELRFPVGGLNRQAGFDQQPPYTTPYCLNVRPYDVVNLSSANMHGMRQRGGARPGIAKTYAQRVGTGPLQMLSYASLLAGGGSGIATNILLAIAGGVLYQNSSGSLASVTGSFNSATSYLRGTQVGSLYYIADYMAKWITGTGGVIGSGGNTLTDSNISSASYSLTTGDVVWISPADPTQANIFPITAVSGSQITFTTTGANPITPQSGVTWQIGRMPKVFDPAANTVSGLMGSLPIPPTNYTTGTVTITNGAVVGSGTSFPTAAGNTALTPTITIPNASGIGTQSYLIASRTDGTHLTLTDTTSDANCTNVAYTLSWTGTYYGVPPLGCNLCCTYRGRLVFAGPGAIWYMSRVLNPNDWDYGYDPNDPSRAVGGTATTTGGIPEPILALMPHSDQYLIFGCEHSLWLLTGDPAYGGQISALSRDIGVLGPGAWCSLPDMSMVILSRDGLYLVSPGAQSYPQPISRPTLPAELVDVDWQANTISMSYDVQARGIHLAVTPNSGAAGVHYFIDWTTKSFWPVTLPNSLQPTGMVRYAPNSSTLGQVVLGSFDGYLRNYSATATTDDGTTFASLVTYGPFRIGGPGYDGQLLQIAADLDTSSTSLTWGIFAGETAQAAVAAAVAGGTAPWTGTWAGGRNHRDFPAARGYALVIIISGGAEWAIEGLRIEGKRKGLIR